MGALLIGDVAAQTGLSAPTIRYYESIGLLKAPSRSASGYRRYSERTITELEFIRKAQALGFALDEIAEILKLSRSGKTPCADVVRLAHRHLDAVDERIRQLQRFRTHLASEVQKWDKQMPPAACDGLCELIATSEAAIAVPLNVSVADRSKRKDR